MEFFSLAAYKQKSIKMSFHSIIVMTWHNPYSGLERHLEADEKLYNSNRPYNSNPTQRARGVLRGMVKLGVAAGIAFAGYELREPLKELVTLGHGGLFFGTANIIAGLYLTGALIKSAAQDILGRDAPDYQASVRQQ